MSQSQATTVMVQGRIVWTTGNLFSGRIKTEYGTNNPKLNAMGEQMKEYGFGLAVPKDVLSQGGDGQPGQVWTAMHDQANQLYPGGQLPPGFSMKFKDGDGVDHNGASFTLREGYANHIVLSCTTSLPIKWFKFEAGANMMINEGIKCGDYVNVQLDVKGHVAIGQGKPGLYLNPMAVQLIGYGKEIINVPNGDQIFGAVQPPMPNGATAAPQAPAGQIMPQAPAMVAPAMPAAQPVTAAPAPHYAVVPPAHQPATAMPAPPQVAAQPLPEFPSPLPGQG